MNELRKLSVLLGDLGSFFLGFCVLILTSFSIDERVVAINNHLLPLSLLTILWIGVFFVFNFYETKNLKPNFFFLKNLVIASPILLGIGFIFFYINPITNVTPKTNLIIFLASSLMFVFIWRKIFYAIAKSIIHTNIAFVVSEKNTSTEHLIQEIKNNPHLGYIYINTYTNLSDFFANKTHVDLLVIEKNEVENVSLFEKILSDPFEVIDLATAYELILNKIPVNFIDHHWVIYSIQKKLGLINTFFTKTISLLTALIVIILTLPITLIVALLIRFQDGGPIFYTQERVGRYGKIFKIIKFRSMYIDSEKNGAVWSSGSSDNRITPVGKIIRKLHIDEIPQMINLIKGDIVLVGPRPERPEFVANLEKEIPYYFMRHTIDPGFTGWAQIKFRYARSIDDSREKFEYDLFYIKNRNIFLDIGIIVKTAQIIFTHD